MDINQGCSEAEQTVAHLEDLCTDSIAVVRHMENVNERMLTAGIELLHQGPISIIGNTPWESPATSQGSSTLSAS